MAWNMVWTQNRDHIVCCHDIMKTGTSRKPLDYESRVIKEILIYVYIAQHLCHQLGCAGGVRWTKSISLNLSIWSYVVFNLPNWTLLAMFSFPFPSGSQYNAKLFGRWLVSLLLRCYCTLKVHCTLNQAYEPLDGKSSLLRIDICYTWRAAWIGNLKCLSLSLFLLCRLFTYK